ncbi:sulfotransferase 2A1-like [Dromiciops gliroides]|uniref:sulfotransferase 2A1-like n=1 Tax=Dromiciops gliroides TaxID=33562 RepID=UPI001CC5B84B|nr:sulfotransferase 2A1-like [Dromiciops gliroides]
MENPNKFSFVKGIPFFPRVHDVEAIKRMWNEFKVRDKDVIIMSYPRSGTHWIIDILSLIYSKGDPTWVKSVPCWKRSPWIEMKNGIEMVKNKSDPRLFSSHLPVQLFPKSYFTSKAKMIYVARNPKDVIVSFYHFNNQFLNSPSWLTFEHFFEGFLQENVMYGSWFDHIKQWLPMREEEKFLFLTYEELHQRAEYPGGESGQAAETKENEHREKIMESALQEIIGYFGESSEGALMRGYSAQGWSLGPQHAKCGQAESIQIKQTHTTRNGTGHTSQGESLTFNPTCQHFHQQSKEEQVPLQRRQSP